MPSYRKPKQVRFAYENTFHSPHTPTLTFAPSSPSSAGPITPPSMSHRLPGPTPYQIAYVPTFPAKQPHHTGPIHPHPFLEAGTLSWDLVEHPSTITRNNHLISGRVLYEQATTPPLPFLTITSVHLPWIIKVYASKGPYVTLGDVFDSIYRSLRTNITNTEFNSFPRENDQKRATRAYEQRYRRLRSPSAHNEEKRAGMKRIDFLMGHTKFHGISNTGRHSDEWRLNVS